MKKRLIVIIGAVLTLAACGKIGTVTEFTVVPEPVFAVQKDGNYTLGRSPKLSTVSLAQNSPVARQIMKSLRSMHMHPSLVPSVDDSDISLVVNDTANPELGTEGYLLEVRPTGVRISANTEAGLLYGYQTLVQMLPPDVQRVSYTSIILPECTVLDYPRFGWRGLHLNLSGSPLTVKQLRRVVDAMSAYKMNRLCIDGGWWSTDSLDWSIDTAALYSRSDMEELGSYAEALGVKVLWDSMPYLADGMESALDSIRRGRSVVLSPMGRWWFERYQADPRYQPQAAEGLSTLAYVYDFEPLPAGTNSHVAKAIDGGMCRLLTDCTSGLAKVEYMILPRMLAVAECLWSPREQKDWNRFRRKVEVQKDRLSARGHAYCEGSFTPQFVARRVDDHTMNISISTEVPNTYIFYTTDLSTPTRQSSIYIGPINLERGTHIKILPVYNNIDRDSVYEFVIK